MTPCQCYPTFPLLSTGSPSSVWGWMKFARSSVLHGYEMSPSRTLFSRVMGLYCLLILGGSSRATLQQLDSALADGQVSEGAQNSELR